MYVLTEKQMEELIISVKEGSDYNITQYKKRSRTKNEVNKKKQCRAKRADGKQCSRQRKEGQDFCGTHIKGCPHGTYKKKESSTEELKLSIIEYKGIPYYVDLSTGKVYASEEIMRKDKELVVVGKYDGVNVEIKNEVR
tara:strand:+ start:1315 stop:1731 length:417 start_codon:yes stop_codon:yes gene_type:complete